MLLLSLPLQAGIVSTEDMLSNRHSEQLRERLSGLLVREDVQNALQARGVDPFAAQQRVQSMTDNEVMALAEHIDQLPAGGRLSTTQWLLIIIIILLIL